MKQLITLEEHNKRATQVNETGGNGIACPNCGSKFLGEQPNKIEEQLWGLLDDIDTASDVFKPCDLESYTSFYNYTLKRVGERFKHITSDGYKLYYNQIGETK